MLAGAGYVAVKMAHRRAGRESPPSDQPDGRKALLDVTRGRIPDDVGSDREDHVKMTIEDCAELGGKALKVAFASPDSFGDRQARVQNWTGFGSLQFDAFNPGGENIRLTLTVRHRGSTNYRTRVDLPVVLGPGKAMVRIPLDKTVNVDGSAPNLSEVGKWYFALESPRAATFYLSSLWLVKAGVAAATGTHGPPAATATVTVPAQRYRVTGKIGDMPVDLVVTPGENLAPAASAAAPPPGRTGL
jgi:hypothetical protein